MIPQIAYFHWEGPPISWLRMLGLYTFARLNPRWEIRLIRTDRGVIGENLPELAHGGDWTRLLRLYDEGGFSLATDTIFLKPIPDEWRMGEMCICTNGSAQMYHCCFGSVARTEFLDRCLAACEKVPRQNIDYQAFGTNLLNGVLSSMGGPGKISGIVDIPKEALAPVAWDETEKLWAPDPLPITDETIGVLWFGGSPHSMENTPSKESAIVKLAIGATGLDL